MYLLLAGTPVPSSHKLVMVTYDICCKVSLSTGDSNYDAAPMKETDYCTIYIFAEGATSPHTHAPNLRLQNQIKWKRSIHIVKLQGSKLLMIGRGELGHEKIYFYRQFCASQCQNINHSAHQQPRYFEF